MPTELSSTDLPGGRVLVRVFLRGGRCVSFVASEGWVREMAAAVRRQREAGRPMQIYAGADTLMLELGEVAGWLARPDR